MFCKGAATVFDNSRAVSSKVEIGMQNIPLILKKRAGTVRQGVGRRNVREDSN
jgi:hypothetical protein